MVEDSCAWDANAVAQFVEGRRSQLLAYIETQLGSQLRSRIEPEDVLQEVSVAACRTSPPPGMGEQGLFGWLRQIADHKIVDAHRRLVGAQKRAAGREVPLGTPGGDTQHAALIDLLRASFTSASKAFSRNEREIELLAALSRLPEDHRRALEMRYAENLASKEIAARMGKSDGAVRVLLTRALNSLREHFGQDV